MTCVVFTEAMERVLMVRGLKSSAGWGFPKGKVNQGERGDTCAAREVSAARMAGSKGALQIMEAA